MSRFILHGLAGLLVACSSGPKTPEGSGASVSAGNGSGVTTTAGSSSGSAQSGSGANAASGTVQAAGSGTAAAGSASGSTMAVSGSAGAPTDGGGVTTSPEAASGSTATSGTYPMLIEGGPCPANALFCDDFEEYPPLKNPPGGLDLTQMLPNWDQFSFHGFPRVDNVPPLLPGKTHSAYLDTEAESYRFAAFIRQTPDGVPVVPLAHFGRIMANIKGVSPMSQWTIIELQGLLPGSTTELATYNFGGNMGHLAAGYAQRKRVLDPDGGVTLRPGGPINAAENAMGTLDCTKTATTQTMTTGKWVCIEWNIDASDATKGVEMHFWLDGVAQTEIDVTGQGTECSIGMPSTSWTPPSMFTKLNLVWEGYGNDSPQQDIGYDEFAIGTQRIGCPQ